MRDPPGPPSAALYTRESEHQLCPISESAPSQSTELSLCILQFGGWPQLCKCRKMLCLPSTANGVSERDGATSFQVVMVTNHV